MLITFWKGNKTHETLDDKSEGGIHASIPSRELGSQPLRQTERLYIHALHAIYTPLASARPGESSN